MTAKVSNAFKLRVALSNSCNYDCFFCHNEGKGDFNSQRLQPEEVVTLCKGASLAGINVFTFTGGEPLMNKRAVEMLSTVRQEIPHATIKLTTNGSLISPTDLPVVAASINKIRLNFQSARRDAFARLVGGDYFERVDQLINEFTKTPVHICLNYVYNKRSKPELPDVIDYARERDLEVKVLELIKYSWNYREYADIAEAGAYLETVALRQQRDYQNDDIFLLPGGSSRIRLCYAHCNTLNGADCRLLGEMRVGSDLALHHCMRVDAERHSLKDLSAAEVAERIVAVDAGKGTCPWSIRELVELSLVHGREGKVSSEKRQARVCQQ